MEPLYRLGRRGTTFDTGLVALASSAMRHWVSKKSWSS